MIISDYISETKSQINGQYFDSKSAYYRHVKENGHEILGNDRPKGPDPEPAITDRDIRDAIQQVEAGKGQRGLTKPPQGWED